MGTMTLFDDNRYDWRETYFVYFESAFRPKLPEIRHALRTHAPFLSVLDVKAEPDGSLVEITIASYEDHAALEIVYKEGDNISAEARHFALTLKEDASEEERIKLQKMALCNTRFDIHHFEQTADTHVFNITKLPELNFAKQTTRSSTPGDFSKAFETDTPERGKFYFDAQSFAQCRSEQDSEERNAELDAADTVGMDSGFERINPEMLVTVLEILCRISRGIALDPASGLVLE